MSERMGCIGCDPSPDFLSNQAWDIDDNDTAYYRIINFNTESEAPYELCDEAEEDSVEGGHGKVSKVVERRASSLKPWLAQKELREGRKEDLQNEANILLNLEILNPTKHRVKLEAAYTIRDERFLLVMSPFANGRNLEEMLRKFTYGDEKPTKEQVQVLLQAMGCLVVGLAALHACGFRHRDLHPGNILFHNEEVRFCYFGTSWQSAYDTPNTTATPWPPRMDRYAAPEVILSHEEHNNATDVFQLGAILFEIYFAIFRPSKLKPILAKGGWRHESHLESNKDSWMRSLWRQFSGNGDDPKVLGLLPRMLLREKDRRPSAMKIAVEMYCAKDYKSYTWMCKDCEAWIQSVGGKEIKECKQNISRLDRIDDESEIYLPEWSHFDHLLLEDHSEFGDNDILREQRDYTDDPFNYSPSSGSD